jgi:prepilin-type N-terminal cleavage/methylation domain-containing protein
MNRGFTLLELLVVIIIVIILAGALVVLVSGLIDQSKFRKTEVMIRSLDNGCRVYQSMFKEFPPTAPHAGSQNLHWYLGRPFKRAVLRPHQGAAGVTRDVGPILEFRRDWLLGNPATTDPSPPRRIVDAFGGVVDYSIEAGLVDGVSIRSNGADLQPQTEDDVRNLGENP